MGRSTHQNSSPGLGKKLKKQIVLFCSPPTFPPRHCCFGAVNNELFFFLPLENLSVPVLYHPREFCLGAGFIHSKPSDVTAPESERFLVTLQSGLGIAHSLVLNNLLGPGSLDKYLCVLSHSFSHTHSLSLLWPLPPLTLSHTHLTQLQQKALHRECCFPAERSPRDRVVC